MDTIIVVPGNHVDRHGQGTEQVPEAFIFWHTTVLHTVPSHEHDIRVGGKTGKVGDGALEVGSGCVLAVGLPSYLGNMGVTDLGNNHGNLPVCMFGKTALAGSPTADRQLQY
jgi:hypothetical protein